MNTWKQERDLLTPLLESPVVVPAVQENSSVLLPRVWSLKLLPVEDAWQQEGAAGGRKMDAARGSYGEQINEDRQEKTF